MTILAGLIIYYSTKEPEHFNREFLVYSISNGGVFEGSTTGIALSAVTIDNIGGRAANNVSVIISFEIAEINDISLDTTAGPKESSREINNKSLALVFENILPSESFTISLLLTEDEKPTVSVRSDSYIAEQKTMLLQEHSSFLDALELTIPIFTFLLIITMLIFIKRLRGYGFELSTSKNNTGFLLLHAGLIDEAFEVLSVGLKSGQYDSLILSNLATCYALKNDFDSAHKLINAANYRDRFGHAKAVILFNEAIILLSEEKISDAHTKLKLAIKISPRTIRNYCNKSVHFKKAKQDENISTLINPN